MNGFPWRKREGRKCPLAWEERERSRMIEYIVHDGRTIEETNNHLKPDNLECQEKEREMTVVVSDTSEGSEIPGRWEKGRIVLYPSIYCIERRTSFISNNDEHSMWLVPTRDKKDKRDIGINEGCQGIMRICRWDVHNLRLKVGLRASVNRSTSDSSFSMDIKEQGVFFLPLFSSIRSMLFGDYHLFSLQCLFQEREREMATRSIYSALPSFDQRALIWNWCSCLNSSRRCEVTDHPITLQIASFGLTSQQPTNR